MRHLHEAHPASGLAQPLQRAFGPQQLPHVLHAIRSNVLNTALASCGAPGLRSYRVLCVLAARKLSTRTRTPRVRVTKEFSPETGSLETAPTTKA